MTPQAAVAAYKLLVNDKVGPAKVVASELHARGLTKHVVDKKTIIRAAKSVARTHGECIRAVRGQPAKALTHLTIQKRLQFCSLNVSRTTWRNVMFTDRKRFYFKFPGSSVQPVTWVRHGECREAHMPNHPLCVNVYAGLTWYGVTKLHIVAGTSKHKSMYKNKLGATARNITQAEYNTVLTQTLLPEAERLFRTHNVTAWTFQQDNDPAHKNACKIIAEYNTQHASNILLMQNWPPSSPDLSPIENLWAIVQSKMDAKGCKTFDEFQSALHLEWQSIASTLTVSFVRSMRARIAMCIQNKGCKTKY